MAIFKGAGVAIVTPMKNNEEVNYDKLEELINQQIDGGTDAIVIAGTTGESATLTMEEHRDVIKAAIEFTKHRVPVVAGTGSNCTRTAIQLSHIACTLPGATLLHTEITPTAPIDISGTTRPSSPE